MTLNDRSNARLRDVLACVGQIHRREQRAWQTASSVRSELAELKSGRAHRLGRLVLQHLESRWGWVRLPIALWRAQRQSSRGDESVETQPSPLRVTVAFNGATRISLPLTLDSQVVRVPRSPERRELWATSVAADRGASSTLQMTYASASTSAADVDSTAYDGVQLVSDRPHLLRTLEAGEGDSLIELARADGHFCIVTLELCAADSPAAKALAEAAARPGAAQADAQRDAIERVPATPAVGAVPFTAEELEQKLWGGYARYALPELEQLKCDPRAAVKQRVAAAWYLTRWYYVADNHARALDNIEFAKALPCRLTPRIPLAEAQCLLHLGRPRQALELLRNQAGRGREPDYRLLESTAARRVALAEGRALGEAEAAQLAILNQVFEAADLAPISKRIADAPLSLANIRCEASPGSREQTLKVSVVVPAYNAEASVGWAIDSLLAQTWRNLEVIVVDDCSDDRTAAIVAAIAARDSRVRLLRLERNRGAYPARNAGAREASGDLIMIHDSDDWSHPQLIETQVEALDTYPRAAAVKSHWVRVGENLETIGTWVPRGSILELNFSSLLFRRRLLDELGYWDDVRIGGDAEFLSRFTAVYGGEALVKIPRTRLLALSLTRQDSLTRSTATHLKSRFYGLRRDHRDAYRWWHGDLQRRHELPFECTARPFPVPLGNKQPERRQQRFGIVVISDFAVTSSACEAALSYCVAAARARRPVAAFHWRHYELTTRVPLQAEFYAVCQRHGVEILSHSDAVEADIVLIADPSVLSYLIEPLPAIAADHVVVTAARGVGAAGAAAFERYDPLIARQNLRDAFGTEGVWHTADSWPAIVDIEALTSAAPRWRGATRRLPVAGRRIVGCFDWPSRPALLAAAHGAGADWEMHFHGDLEQLRGLTPELPPNWRLVSNRSVGGTEFCRDLDFYLHYPHELHERELSRGLLEAMALGIPVVAAPQFGEYFGDAVVLAAPHETAGVMQQLWSSEIEYLARASAARAFVAKHHGMADFMARLENVARGETALDAPAGAAPRSQCA